MSFLKQVMSLASSVFAVAANVVAPVVILAHGPLNLLWELSRAVHKPGSPAALLGFGDPGVGLIIAVLKFVVGIVLVCWMSKVFIHEMKERLPESSGKPLDSYSIAAGCLTGTVYVIAVMLGFALLIVPGVVVLVRGAVCIPVSIAERRGPIAALRRSWELTEGWHWPIQGVVALLILMGAGTVAVLVGLLVWIPGGTTVLGKSILLTVANVVGWSTITAVESAMYVRLAFKEEPRRSSAALGNAACVRDPL